MFKLVGEGWGFVCLIVVLGVLAVVAAIDVFGNDFQLMSCPQRTYVVSLKGVLRKVLACFQKESRVVERHVLHITVVILLL